MRWRRLRGRPGPAGAGAPRVGALAGSVPRPLVGRGGGGGRPPGPAAQLRVRRPRRPGARLAVLVPLCGGLRLPERPGRGRRRGARRVGLGQPAQHPGAAAGRVRLARRTVRDRGRRRLVVVHVLAASWPRHLRR